MNILLRQGFPLRLEGYEGQAGGQVEHSIRRGGNIQLRMGF
ncbi:MAG: hypothetical protein WC637_11745 [Victivallales bacterium]|jgi:hypothetical protein